MSELLSSSQLAEQTNEQYRRVFGNTNIVVANPTELALETQRIAQGEGYGFLTPCYFPFGETKLDSPGPLGWKKLEPWFFDQMRGTNPRVSPDAAKIGPYWTLFDESVRPEFSGDEKFGLILVRGRQQGKIAVSDHVKHLAGSSRFGISMDEQDGFIFPELAKLLRLVDKIAEGQVSIRRPKVAEFNFVGNLKLKHLGEDRTWEGFEDKFGDNNRLIGGDSRFGGLSYVRCRWRDGRHVELAFRPIVVFSSHSQSLVTW